MANILPAGTLRLPKGALDPPDEVTGAWLAPVLARYNKFDVVKALVNTAMQRWSTINHVKFTVYRTQPKMRIQREELLPEVAKGIKDNFMADLKRGMATTVQPTLKLLEPVDFEWLGDILLRAYGFEDEVFEFDYHPTEPGPVTINIFPTPKK